MTASLRRYVAIETAIAVLANIVMSDAAAAIVFHGLDRIPVTGSHGLAADMVVQSFAVAFMSVLIATLLTRRRRRNGKVDALPGPAPRGPRAAFARALLVGLGCAIVSTPIAFALAHAGAAPWTRPAMFALKTVWAIVLALLVSPPALLAALRDRVA